MTDIGTVVDSADKLRVPVNGVDGFNTSSVKFMATQLAQDGVAAEEKPGQSVKSAGGSAHNAGRRSLSAAWTVSKDAAWTASNEGQSADLKDRGAANALTLWAPTTASNAATAAVAWRIAQDFLPPTRAATQRCVKRRSVFSFSWRSLGAHAIAGVDCSSISGI
jgi:hypothetical protein